MEALTNAVLEILKSSLLPWNDTISAQKARVSAWQAFKYGRSLFFAVIFRSLIVFCLALLTVFICLYAVVLSPLCLVYLILCHFDAQKTSSSAAKRTYFMPVLSAENFNLIENQLIATRKLPCEDDTEILNDWMNIEVDIDIYGVKVKKTFKIHSIIGKSNSAGSKPGTDKPILVWFHGVGSSAMTSCLCNGLMDRLVNHYDVYAIDIPMWGRSIAPQELMLATGLFIIIRLASLCLPPTRPHVFNSLSL